MGRGDRPVAGDAGANGDPERVGLEARNNLLLAAADGQQPRTWSRDDGGRYFDQPQGNGRPQQAGQAQWTEIPTVGGNTVRIDPRGNMVDIIGADGKPLGRGRLNKGEVTPITIGDTKILVNPDMTVEVPTAKGLTKSYPTGTTEYYDRIGDTYRIASRTFPDRSYEKFNQGRLAETNYNGFITRFDEFSRKTDVITPKGDRVAFKYGASGKVDSYEVTKTNGTDVQLVERGAKGPDGYLRIERRQPDGAMRIDSRLANRTDVAIRADLNLDYLDKDGYSMPDVANRRMVKRDDRTVLAQAEQADGKVVSYPVNPIRSIRFEDGRQIDYEYSSDRFRNRGNDQGADGLLSYTIRDRNGRAVEFGHKIPDIPGTTRKNNTGWLEYKATPGTALPEDQIVKVKQLMVPGDPARLGSPDPAERAKAQQELVNNRTQLVQDKPMKDFMPKLVPGEKGRDTVDVALDPLTGRQYNTYGNGDIHIRNERGQGYFPSVDNKTGDSFENYDDGTLIRRAWDADPKKGELDRVTITALNADGVPRVEFHHTRRKDDNSYIDVDYDKTGRVPTSVTVTPPNGQPIRMEPADGDRSSWLEYRREGDVWKPTGRAFPMKVDLVGNDRQFTSGGQRFPAGTIVISQGDKRRIITPAGEEIVGRTGSTPFDTVPDREGIFVTPKFPLSQNYDRPQNAPPDWVPPGTRRDGRPKEAPQQPRALPDRQRLQPKR